jgi:hypothetical protein
MNTARHFASHGDGVVAPEPAVPHHNVPGRDTQRPGFHVPSGLDGDVVIPVIEGDIFDQYVIAALGIDAVIIQVVGIKTDPPDRNMA